MNIYENFLMKPIVYLLKLKKQKWPEKAPLNWGSQAC